MESSQAQFPLPDSKLPRVDLSSRTLAQWKSEAKRFVRSVVHNRQSWYFRFEDYQHLYKRIYAKHNTHGCARVIKKTKMIEFLSRGELEMTLDELIYSLYCKTTSEQRAVYAQLYQEVCLDGALLKLFEGPTPSDSFYCVAAKWIALRSPMSKIFKGSDFIYFEYCFTTTDISGRKVLIEFKRSNSLRPDQLNDHDLDLARRSMFVLNTYYMENKRVVMHTMGEHDIAAKFPVWFALGVMPTFFKRVGNHQGLLYSRSLTDAGVTVDSLADRRAEASPGCRVCSKKFKLMRGKKWCRRCGHPVCRDCVTEVVMLKTEFETASRLPFESKRFCLLCLFIIREQRTAVSHESTTDRPSSLFSIGPDEANMFDQSRSTAIDRSSRHSLDESLLMFRSESYLDDADQQSITRRTTRSNSFFGRERESLTSDPRTSLCARSIELIAMARVAADEAAMLRSMYEQECLRRLTRYSTTLA